jgi:hypothetical protein
MMLAAVLLCIAGAEGQIVREGEIVQMHETDSVGRHMLDNLHQPTVVRVWGEAQVGLKCSNYKDYDMGRQLDGKDQSKCEEFCLSLPQCGAIMHSTLGDGTCVLLRRDCKPEFKHKNHRTQYSTRVLKLMYKRPSENASRTKPTFVDPPGLQEHIFPDNGRLERGSDGKKTLVVLIGSARGGERTWQSLYKNVLDVNKADLALVFGRETPDTDSVGDYVSRSLFARAAYWWTVPELGSRWGLGLDAMLLQQLRDNETDISPCVYKKKKCHVNEERLNATDLSSCYCSWEDIAATHGDSFLGGTRPAIGYVGCSNIY